MATTGQASCLQPFAQPRLRCQGRRWQTERARGTVKLAEAPPRQASNRANLGWRSASQSKPRHSASGSTVAPAAAPPRLAQTAGGPVQRLHNHVRPCRQGPGPQQLRLANPAAPENGPRGPSSTSTGKLRRWARRCKPARVSGQPLDRWMDITTDRQLNGLAQAPASSQGRRRWLPQTVAGSERAGRNSTGRSWARNAAVHRLR